MMADVTKTRKITVRVSRKDLASAQSLTGETISETVRIALRLLVLERRYPEHNRIELLERARQPLSL
jgi:hypothetical protein